MGLHNWGRQQGWDRRLALAGWCSQVGAGPGRQEFLFCGRFMGGCYYTLLFLKIFSFFFFLFFFFFFVLLGVGAGHTGGFM